MTYINDYCLGLIREGKIDLAYRILKKSEGFCVVGRYSTSVKYRVIVLNHLGCCMRRFGKNKVALGYLASAFKIAKSTNSPDLLAISCLNLCAVYRQLEDHKKVVQTHKALEYARKASSEYSHLIINSNPEDFDSRQAYEEDYRDKVRQLAICYHNLSVEEDHFANSEKSLEFAKKAYQLMKSKFGENNNITKKFKANYYNKLNNDAPETQSVFTLRHLSEKGKSRRDESKVSLGKKLPEWKIKTNPYGGTTPSKFHGGCNPHPEFSQYSKRPVPKYNSLVGQGPVKATRQPVTLKIKKDKKDRLESAKARIEQKAAKEDSDREGQHDHRKLEFKATLQELEELGVTSSDDSEEERIQKMKANRAKFGQAVGLDYTRKDKAKKALDGMNAKEAEVKEEALKNKKEQEKKKLMSDKDDKEKAAILEIAQEKKEANAGLNIANFLTAKDLIDKQHQASNTVITRSGRKLFCAIICRQVGISKHCAFIGSSGQGDQESAPV